MTEKVYGSHLGLILKHFKDLVNYEQKLNFNHDALQEMHFEFQNATF